MGRTREGPDHPNPRSQAVSKGGRAHIPRHVASEKRRGANSRFRLWGDPDCKFFLVQYDPGSASTEGVPRAHPETATTSQTSSSSGVDFKPFIARKGAIALCAGHPLTALDVITPRDLHGQDLIALAPEDTTRKEFDSLLERASAQPRVIFETPFSATICAMVQAGLGCGLVYPPTAEIYMPSGLQLRPFEPTVMFRALMLFPPGRKASRKVQSCIQELEKLACSVPM